MIAWALLVVSSEGQAETLQHQRSWAAETAKAKGWTLEREFAGVSSGRDGPRRLMRELIAELRNCATAQLPTWLLMVRADRVGRGRIAESQIALHEIVDLGVRIWTRDSGELKLDSATDQIIAAVKAGLAGQENEVRRDKAIAVYRRRAAAGQTIGNRLPYGLLRGKDGAPIVVEDQAEIVRMIFRLRLEGLGYIAIARRMLALAPPIRFKDGSERPVHWSHTRVKHLLGHRAFVPAVIDEVTFRRVQQIVGHRDQPRRRFAYPLSGAVRCYCGFTMTGSPGGKGGLFRRYACGDKMHGRTVSAKRLEAQFDRLIRWLERGERSPVRVREPVQSPALFERATARLRAKIATLDRQRDAVWRLHAEGKIRDDAVQPRLDALSAQREAAVAQLTELEGQRAVALDARRRAKDGPAAIATLAGTYASATPEEQRRIARAVADYLGGLVVEADGSLAVRRVAPPSSRAERV